MKYRLFLVVLALAAVVATGREGAAQEEFPFEIFGRYLEPLARQIGMPGVSAAIIQTGRNSPSIVRRYNYGYADLERKVAAWSDTPYPIGGATQAFTGVLHGACIDRFTTSQFDIDTLDMRLFVPAFPVANTSVRQLLSHSTDGRFRYDPLLFANLTPVVESARCFNRPFRQSIAAEILNFIGMTRSVPGMDLNRAEGAAARVLFDESAVSRYQAVLNDIAVPYRIDIRGRASRSEYPSYGLDAASGLVSTVDDLIKFQLQLDKSDGHPLSPSTLDQMWSRQLFDLPQPNGSSVRVEMPTGLGWFVTNESGQRLVWTFGHIQDAASALIVKMTKRQAGQEEVRLTLIMLANSGGLANTYDFENANVTSSPFVKVFLRLFI
jgi:CubicO group peptidase (beta-lactamase class C family)